MPSCSGSTDRSAIRVACGACSRLGRWESKAGRTERACRATDRSIEIEVVQDPGGRRERPSGSREPPERSGRTTPHLRHVPGGAFHVSPSECDAKRTKSSTPSASTRTEALIDNRWSGKNSSTASPWSAVGRRGMVQWAEDSRDSRCSAHPLLRRAAGAPHRSLDRPPARARCRTHLVQEGRSPREPQHCRRSSVDREHLATNEGVGSSNLSDGVTVGVIRG